MRYIDSTLKARLEKAHQTLYENSNPAMSIWISRNRTPIEEPLFWERAKIDSVAAISAVSLAARRMDIKLDADRIYIAYCQDGKGYIKYATQASDISKMIWNDSESIADAVDISLAFDGRMVKTIKGTVEFQTESNPWIFWVTAAGALYGKKLGDETVQLATENCAKVSAIHGMHSEVAGFDQGLLVFFLLGGLIYYRSLISGVWQDATSTNFGPSVTWVDIAAGRTWDYRIVLQALDQNNKIYELFTYTESIAKQNVEHIEINKISADGEQIDVTYSNTQDTEHIEISHVSAEGNIIYGLSPVPVEIVNIDNGAGNWGIYLTVSLDYPITDVAGNAAGFVMTDGNSATYTATAISVCSDGKTLTLVMPDFNAAYGTVCTLTYTPGTILGPSVALAAFSAEFAPVNLVAPIVDPPEVEAIWNE